MEHRTSKAHPELNLTACKNIFAEVKEELCGEQIASPFDIYSVERLRDEHDLRKGPAFLTDVFVFGKGAAPQRHLTKVAGVPYWPQGRAWPQGDNGEKYQFLAQFCFTDSFDLVPKLPADLLLIFVPQDDEEWLWETD